MKKTSLLILLMLSSLWAEEKTATFGGGCFWCMEAAFQPLPGVINAESGYMGGTAARANYHDVSQGTSGHYEVVQVKYDSNLISYKELLQVFWKNIDPTDKYGQFSDKGKQYKTVIFYQNTQERDAAVQSKETLETSAKFDIPIATDIKPANEFYRAEEYHQDYFKKNSLHYQLYKKGSGREDYIKKTWK